jgi:hypothetical protein
MCTPRADLVSVYPYGSYGCGMMMHSDRGVGVVEHGGNHLSFSCSFKMILPLKPEVVPEPLPMNESEVAEYAGNYRQDPGNPKAIASVIAKCGKLLLNGGSGHEVSVEKVGTNRFAIIMPGIDPSYFGFVPGKDGSIKYLHSGLRAYPKIES